VAAVCDNRWGSFSNPQSNQIGVQTASRRTAENNYTNIPTLSVPNHYITTVNKIEALCQGCNQKCSPRERG